MTSSDIRNETMRDATLSQVFMRARDGFPQHEDNELLKPYHQRRTELSITDGCLVWGARVVIPSRYRKATWAAASCGGPALTVTLREQSIRATSAGEAAISQQKLRCNHGHSQTDRGHECICRTVYGKDDTRGHRCTFQVD